MRFKNLINKVSRYPVLIPVFLVALNFIVKGLFLGSNPLGGDESFSIYHAQMDIRSIIDLLASGNNPPLYEIFLHGWITLFGISEFAVRFPSLIFSSITLWYLFKTGDRYINRRVAIYASIIFIFSNYHIFFAHEARVYPLLGMLSTISMYHFLSIINRKTNTGHNLEKTLQKHLIILIISNLFLVYSHYFGFFILITQAVFLLLNKSLRIRFWKPMLLAAVILFLGYLPNLATFLHRFMDSSAHGTWLKAPTGIEGIYNMLWRFSNAPVVTVAAIGILLAAAIKFFIKRKKENPSLTKSFIIFWFLFIFFFMFGISYKVPMFLDRYLMPAAVAYVLLLAIAADYLLKNEKLKLLFPGIICILFLVTAKPDLSNQRDTKGAVMQVKALQKENTTVIFCPAYFFLDFAYYYDNELFKNYNTQSIYHTIDSTLRRQNIYGVTNIAEAEISDSGHILYLDAAADFSFPDNNILNTLDGKFRFIQKHEIDRTFSIYKYEKE